MAPVVHLREAVCVLGRFPALAGVTLDVEAGEILLVQGPNGAGKSTLLRLCAGLLEVSSGEATVLGHDLTRERRSIRGRVAMLGHGPGLYDDLTVRDNVRFWARAAGRGTSEVDQALDQAGIPGRLHDVDASRLSAGQRRRTALASLLVRHAELWLLDEPHAGLDPAGRDLVDHLVTSAAAAGATVLLASHDLDRAAPLSRRSVTISGGIVTAETSRSSAVGPPLAGVSHGA